MSLVFPVLRKQDFLLPKCFKSHLAITVQHFWAGCRVPKEAVRQSVGCQAPGTELGIAAATPARGRATNQLLALAFL